MNIVVDANLISSLSLPLPYSDLAVDKITWWKQERVSLFAPSLLLYELSTTFRKAIVAGYISPELVAPSLEQFHLLGVEIITPTLALQEAALRFAKLLGQSKTYDAHYLSVADQMHAQLWTADRRLANNARGAGLDWVRWLGDE